LSGQIGRCTQSVCHQIAHALVALAIVLINQELHLQPGEIMLTPDQGSLQRKHAGEDLAESFAALAHGLRQGRRGHRRGECALVDVQVVRRLGPSGTGKLNGRSGRGDLGRV
ncbi:hypothetical protein RZS08_47970, partial [Arthrospira platensis SPKY1]|nr:hypothetical protein [Arthrospira platensis SPKY1]